MATRTLRPRSAAVEDGRVGIGAAQLEVASLALTGILALWLGLTVLTRFPTAVARAFVLLALTLSVWCGALTVERLSATVAVVSVGRSVEELATGAVLPALAGLTLFIATEGRPRRWQVGLLVCAYVLNVGLALPGDIARSGRISISVLQFTTGPIPATDVDTARIIVRVVTILVAIATLLGAYRGIRLGSRRRQLGITLAAVVLAGAGGSLRVFDAVMPTDPWIGISMIGLAMVLMASVVFTPGYFFTPEVAGRAFWTSLGQGLALFLLIGLLLLLDTASHRLLGLEAPLPTIFVLVVAVAAYQPAAVWARSRLRGRTPTELARERLLHAMGPSAATRRPAEAELQSALMRLADTLGLAGAAVVRADGTIAAAHGDMSEVPTASSFALVASNEVVGELRVGSRRSGEPLSPSDQALVQLSAAYASVALQAGRREHEQATALDSLVQDRANTEAAAARLLDAMVRRSSAEPGLRVFALGPLRVERAGEPIERWGGEKAGTRQALGLFAFLFDRGERGVQKDEAIELIWPDTDVERADLAFHRTLGGLRHTLGRDAQAAKWAIRFHNDRYRLDPVVVDWSDLASFEASLAGARQTADAATSLRRLEEARAAYRGEYLDDCPFYGDSVFVEERRASLRTRYADLLVELGGRYEAAGDRASAAEAFREAIASADDPSPRATAGLARLAGGS